MTFFSEDIELLRNVYEFEKIDIYIFHIKYKLSPFQLLRSIKKFEADGIIKFENNSISITELGRDWIFANRGDIFLKERKKDWKEPLFNDVETKLGLDDPYKPDRKKLDKELFKDIEGRKGN